MNSHIEILNKYNIKAKKSLWQNFLIDNNLLEKIVNTIDIRNKNILEVWPWYWALTYFILKNNPKTLKLVELDKFMVNILKDRENTDFKDLINLDLNIKNNKLTNKINNKKDSKINFEIINSDILKYKTNIKDYSVIANIPYYITSPIITHFIYANNAPDFLVLLMQKDVAKKIVDKTNKMSILRLSIELQCENSYIAFDISPKSFIPAPKVMSSVLVLKTKKNINTLENKKVLDLAKKGFSSKRKKLISNLVKATKFSKSNILKYFKILKISDNSRAEELSINNWIELYRWLNS